MRINLENSILYSFWSVFYYFWQFNLPYTFKQKINKKTTFMHKLKSLITYLKLKGEYLW